MYWINRYLAEARLFGVGPDNCHFLFLPFVSTPRGDLTKKKRGMWNAGRIAERITLLTNQYLPDSPGFAPHTFRHVIATDHLKRNLGDYLTVAKLLHDKLGTVLQEYSHVTVEQGLSFLHQGIKELSVELA